MEKINIAEILKDCPQGMELDCTNYNGIVTFEKIIDCAYYPIKIGINYGGEYFQHTLTKYGESGNAPYNKCIIFPKGKTTWKEGLGSFKDGDILVSKSGSIFMFKEPENISLYGCYFALTFDKTIMRNNSDHFCTKDGCRFATEEEKKELFNILQTKGYKWNSEAKTLEKLIPKFKVGDRIVKKNGICVPIWITGIGDGVYYSKTKSSIGILSISEQDEWEVVAETCKIITLKPFDKVLVRDKVGDVWRIQLFEKYEITDIYPYVCMGHNNRFNQCIPYEGNEHLLGTIENCSEYYHRIEIK